MPWAKISYERTVEAYKEILGDVISNHQIDVDLVSRELLVRGNILKYDFTKRQMIILIFIIGFSFNFGKEWAYIPKLSDFEVAGISKFKIRNELNKLLTMNVIEWNQDEHLFRIKEPKFWDAPINVGYKDQRSRELFILNLEHSGIDTTTIIKKIRKLES